MMLCYRACAENAHTEKPKTNADRIRSMTECEAIDYLKNHYLVVGSRANPPKEECEKHNEVMDRAIKALEEIQRWHTDVINPKIKNVSANTSTLICHNCDHKDEYIEELEAEVEEYRAIGTPEECQTAMEKQTAKRPYYEGDGYAGEQLVYDTWICPCCGKRYEVFYDDYDYCPNCGQKLDWCDDEVTDADNFDVRR